MNKEKISCFGAYGFVLGEFCRQFPDEVIRIEKHEIVPPTNRILYGISTTDNYNVFENPTLDIETNLLHLMDVLDACYKTFGNDFEFNFISSWFVYGKSEFSMLENFPLMEEAPCNPTGFYSITKRTAEQLLISYCTTFKIKYRILRLANVLGHKDKKVSKKKNALQYLIDRLVHNEDIELYDAGNFHRDYIDVRDCVRAIHLVMNNNMLYESPEQEPKIYNISNGVSHKFKDLIDLAKEYSGSKSNIWDKMDKPEFHSIVQSKNVFLANEKLAKLGYVPQITMEQTLKDIINEYKGH